jgi:NADH:ubiquinone oxidoreductase subunit 6 (subunit J)
MKKGDSTQAIVVKLLVVGLLVEVMLYSVFSLEWGDIGNTVIKTAEIGEVIFNQYGVAVLMLGLLLLSAIMGGVFIAQEDDE